MPTDTFPNEKQLDPDGARQEYEAQIGDPDYGDFPVDSRHCYWCGCHKKFWVNGRCPNPDCNEESE